MNFNDLLRQYRLRQRKKIDKDDVIAKRVLMEYSKKCELLYPITGSYMDDLLHNYFLLKNTRNGSILEDIMNRYGFNCSSSIHEAIYYLLGMKQDLGSEDIEPLLWPGVEDIENRNGFYLLKTVLGEIKVSKASDIFKGTSSSYIFDKPLIGKCNPRSYEFIRENKYDYSVILSYMPNFFSGGYYHTYLESDTSVLDIAANSYYSEKEDSSKILNGRIIKKLSYREIERNYNFLSKRMPELSKTNNPKLLILSLYYDYRKRRR